MSPFVLFLVGPTAAGKSQLAITLAHKLGGEIVSADSMQVYKGMNIGTAKLGAKDQEGIRHHLLNIRAPGQEFSAYEYRKLALQKIAEIVKRNKVPIVVGGTGLYVRALLEGLSEHPGADLTFRKKMEERAKKPGLATLYWELQKKDPKRALKIQPRDKKRIIRALEILSSSGKRASDWHGEKTPLRSLGYEPMVIGVMRDRAKLYAGIEERVDEMFRKGFVSEVKRLGKVPFSKTAIQAVGYREVLEVLKGRLTLDGAKHLMKQKTRQLAKRQLTWFRREKGIEWFTWEEGEGRENFADRILNRLGISSRLEKEMAHGA